MMSRISLAPLVLLAVALANEAKAQILKPVMGYNSYNHVACTPTDASMTAVINSLSSKGLVTAGYKYFQIDCGWAATDKSRNSTNGAIKVNTSRFPNGLQPLANLARSKGMQWTMYSDAGYRMCDSFPVAGSLGHEAADAAFFASLGTVYIKYDNCYADGEAESQAAPKNARTDYPSRYGAMWNALKANGINSMLICQWGAPYTSSSGLQGPNQWTQGISTSFRLSDDITNSWRSVNQIYNQAIHIAASGLIRPGHHADMDLLQVGNNGMTITEQATHFASWAMLKSALMLSTNIPNLSTEVQNIVSNKGLIAINQDDLGTPVVLVQRFTNNYDVWMGNLTNGDRAVLVVDQSNTARTLTLNFATLGLASATVANLWTSATTTAATSYASSVQGHGSLALRLSSVKAAAASSETINYIAASSGAVGGGASVSSCSACSSGKKVGSVGGSGGTLTLSGITTSKTSQTVRFDYINGDVGFSFGTATNDRLASISVNGGAGQTVSFPLSGYNWDKDVTRGYKVDLTGFKVGGGNTIKISGVSGGYAPDFDRVGIVTSGGSTGTTAPTSTVATTTNAPTSSPTGACAAIYGQCGGDGYTGATCCSSGTCKFSNQYYSQCL